jgi:hypothetical protein
VRGRSAGGRGGKRCTVERSRQRGDERSERAGNEEMRDGVTRSGGKERIRVAHARGTQTGQREKQRGREQERGGVQEETVGGNEEQAAERKTRRTELRVEETRERENWRINEDNCEQQRDGEAEVIERNETRQDRGIGEAQTELRR